MLNLNVEEFTLAIENSDYERTSKMLQLENSYDFRQIFCPINDQSQNIRAILLLNQVGLMNPGDPEYKEAALRMIKHLKNNPNFEAMQDALLQMKALHLIHFLGMDLMVIFLMRYQHFNVDAPASILAHISAFLGRNTLPLPYQLKMNISDLISMPLALSRSSEKRSYYSMSTALGMLNLHNIPDRINIDDKFQLLHIVLQSNDPEETAQQFLNLVHFSRSLGGNYEFRLFLPHQDYASTNQTDREKNVAAIMMGK